MESSIEQYFTKAAKRQGALAFKFVSPGNRGVPDRLVIHADGSVNFAEFKKPGEKLRPDQRLVKRRLERLHQTVHVIDSKQGVDDYWSIYA